MCSAMDETSADLKRIQDERAHHAVDIDIIVELKQGQVEVCDMCHKV